MNISPRVGSLIAAIAAAGLSVLVGCSSGETPTPSTNPSANSSVSGSGSVGGSQNASSETTGYTGLADTVASTEPDANTGTNSAAATNQPPAPTTPVPPPATGDVNQEAPVTAQSTDNPVPLSATADSGNGVSIAVTGVESMTTQAQLPGEISGPGVRVSVNIVNGSTAALDLGNVVVDLQDSTGVPANPMSASPAAPFSGSLAAGGTATAVYVFTLPSTYSDPATIYLTYTTEAAVVVFVGNIK